MRWGEAHKRGIDMYSDMQKAGCIALRGDARAVGGREGEVGVWERAIPRATHAGKAELQLSTRLSSGFCSSADGRLP